MSSSIMRYFLLLTLFPAVNSYSTEMNCEERIPWLEEKAINIVTLYGQRWGLKNLTVGSYTYKHPKVECEYHILITYETEDSTPQMPDLVFRYFHFTPFGFPMTPIVSMHARQPNFDGTGEIEKINPPYGCEDGRELEDWFPRKWVFGKKGDWTASTSFSRKKFPFCEYHVFVRQLANNDDPEKSEITLTHIMADETWESNGYRSFPGRRVQF